MTYPKVYVTENKHKNISRHPICLTDSEYDYILEEIGRQYKIGFEIGLEVYSNDELNVYDHFI